jgi:hypothetical protein
VESGEWRVESPEAARTIRIVLLICAILGLALSTDAATTPAVQKLLPARNEVAGFDILKDSLIYGKGADLAKIYDGGYELYTKAGVIDAAKQMYQRGNDYVEVVVHTMKSDKAALDFVKYWAKDRGGKPARSKNGTGFTVTKPNVMAYYAMGKHFVTVAAFHAPEKAAKDAGAFVAAISKKIGKGNK